MCFVDSISGTVCVCVDVCVLMQQVHIGNGAACGRVVVWHGVHGCVSPHVRVADRRAPGAVQPPRGAAPHRSHPPHGANIRDKLVRRTEIRRDCTLF